ncbi:putative nucleotidyl transferase [Lyophyllum shimeji]|uniref:Translation initiation factor eIF2B subunit epsilon n=1 Tax=Lyophyllum shimeji TaxID=47721 RepID=A0A9P3PGH2_LYOSH|nr:putative nucleotidyl transferase [Lyophyllum shimeji]
MAPKSSSPGKEKLIEDEEEVLQAVILADSFNKRFRPLTTRKPRCLLPICNAPLLDWTFESLALAGVQEIFVVCRSHAEQVKAAIKESKWSKPGSGIKIVPILTAKETFSPGDAMRDIYTRGLVTSDFVLVMGDLVSNIRIDEVVRVHKERRKTNKDAIMTMVVKESGARHRTKARGDSSVFVLDSETSECLYYEAVTGYPKTTIAHVPREILAAHPEIEIRNDLIDCSIDVCSVEVPSLFQDNFDYLDIRKDFVHGVLTSDLLMKNIHCYVAKEGYAARVKDTKSYESVSKDILSRWTFPLVPDDNHPGGHAYDHERGNKYIAKDQSVVLARTCTVGNNTLIGSSTHIGENAQILGSVVGQNCRIGTGTIIRNSYIFDGTVIGSECTIERSILGANVTVKDGSEVPKGCLLGEDVVIGPSAKLKPFQRLSKKRDQSDETAPEEEEDEDSDLEAVESAQDTMPKTLGADSNALVWPTAPGEDTDEDEISNFKNERFMRLGDDASDLDDTDEGSESSVSESDSEEESDSDVEPSALAAPLDSSFQLNLPDGLPRAQSEFQTEVKQSIERAFAEGHSVANAALELKTLRMASNVPIKSVREAVIAEIVEKIQVVEGGGVAQRREIASVIGRWGSLIEAIGGMDAVETISSLQIHCASSTRLPLFGQILAALYQDDIVEEDDIREWHKLPASRGEGLDKENEVENLKKCWSIGAHMIKQFDEQDSESEENDSGDGNAKGDTGDEESDEEESEEGESAEEESEEESEGEANQVDDKEKTTEDRDEHRQKKEDLAATEALEEEEEEEEEEDSSSEGDEDESEEEEPTKEAAHAIGPAAQGHEKTVKGEVTAPVAASKAEGSSADEEDEDDEDDEEDGEDEEDSDEEDSDEEESSEEVPAANVIPPANLMVEKDTIVKESM